MAESALLENPGASLSDPVILRPHEPSKLNPFDDKATVKVMLGEPSAGVVDCIAHDNRLDIYMDYARLESRSRFKFFTGNTGRSGVNFARETMANEAITQNMDYLFMIDDDMLLPKRCFERVFEALEREKADMAAPICTQRVAPFHPVMYRHTVEEVNGVQHINNQFITDYEPNSTITVDGFGFGVVLISVPFLRKMRDSMPDGMFFSNRNVGEDIWFCMMARMKHKAKIVVDTSIKVGHLRHPEMASEYDFVKAKGLLEKFKKVYGGTEQTLKSIAQINGEL